MVLSFLNENPSKKEDSETIAGIQAPIWYSRTFQSFGFEIIGIKAQFLKVDGEILKQALEQKIYLKEEIPKVFQGPSFMGEPKWRDLLLTNLVVTNCTVSELRKKGDDYQVSLFMVGLIVSRAQKYLQKECKEQDVNMRTLSLHQSVFAQ